MDIQRILTHHIISQCDISDHLITLSNLASDCESILECGVRDIVSSWAFMNGLTINRSINKELNCCDMELSPNHEILKTVCDTYKIKHQFFVCSDLNLEMKEYDMIFIDTWHIYGHLKRELQKMHSYAKKYIVMHDTEVDGVYGESLRLGFNIDKLSEESGYAKEEICQGLQLAISEFLVEHPEWKPKAHYPYNNGLTVLERV
jgi:hypothetical protein